MGAKKMSKHIVVYTKDNCSYCVMAKQYLQSKNLMYTEMKLGTDLSRDEFVSIFPEVKSMPFIIIDGEKVGGYDKLQEWTSRPEQQFLAG